jgi:O-antigen/teichoic acid export membrane protein
VFIGGKIEFSIKKFQKLPVFYRKLTICPLFNNTILDKIKDLIRSQRNRLKNLSALLLANFIIMGLGFTTRVIIANSMGKGLFGEIAYGMAIGTFGMVFIRFGQDRTLVRDLIHRPDEFGKLVAGSLLLRCLIFGASMFGLLVWQVTTWRTRTVSLGVIAIAVSYFLLALDLQAVYDSWRQMKRHALYNLMQKILYFSIIWVTFLFSPKRLTINLVGYSMLVTSVLYLAMQHRWAVRRIEFPHAQDRLIEVALSMGRGNLTVFLAAIGGLLIGTLNQLILRNLGGNEELGGYAASWQIAMVVISVLTQVSRIGGPETARVTVSCTKKAERVLFLAKYSGVMLIIAAPVAIPMMIIPGKILEILFSPEYASAAGCMSVMGAYLMVLAVGMVSEQYLISNRLERLYLGSVMSGGFLSIFLCIALIPKLSELGAAVALLVSHGTSLSLCTWGMLNDVRSHA